MSFMREQIELNCFKSMGRALFKTGRTTLATMHDYQPRQDCMIILHDYSSQESCVQNTSRRKGYKDGFWSHNYQE